MLPPAGCVELCPGCRYRSLSNEESDARKHAWVSRNLATLGTSILPLKAPRQRWGYRRKALLHAYHGSSGWEFGLLRRFGLQRRESEVVPIPACPLHSVSLNNRLMVLRTLIPAELPLVFVQASGFFFTLVLKCHASEAWRAWGRGLESPLRAAGVEGLQLNWNPSAGRRALSARHQEIIFGPPLLQEEGLLHGALSFRQQIPELETEALDMAESFLAGAQLPQVVDLYSGAGASIARWRNRNWRSAGVELLAEACRAAELNAPGALVLKGRVEDRIPQLQNFLDGMDFTLYTNPPRDGHSPEVIDWIKSSMPARIAYLSCNPRSLAADLQALREFYQTNAVQPFDFFPQTDHVESLALLERKVPRI